MPYPQMYEPMYFQQRASKVSENNVAMTWNISHDKDRWSLLRYGVPPLRLNVDGGRDAKSL